MTDWPDFLSVADLAPGDERPPAGKCRELRLHEVASPDDPLFDIGYRLLSSEFAARREVERREVLVARLQWRGERAVDGHRLLYRMMLLLDGDEAVAVRDHTAILREGGTEVVVHLSHSLVVPAWRGKGVAAILRALPLRTARACAAAAGPAGAGATVVESADVPAHAPRATTLVAEMSAWDPRKAEGITRLRSYERAGFGKVYPDYGYCQPDFGSPEEIDAAGGPRPLPLDLIVRRIGREHERVLAREHLHDIVASLYAMFGHGIRDIDMQPCRQWAKRILAYGPAEFTLIKPTGGGTPIPVYYSPGFAAPIGEKHIMPMRKFALVAEAIRGAHADLREPEPISPEALRRAHTAEYIGAVETGDPRALAESQKFPWSPALYPAVRLTNGGVLAAARAALDHGIAACLASGFHHACPDHGEGFCTFNGLVVALDALQAQGLIRRGAILDLDLHYGNGTAAMAATRPYITAVSVYGSDYGDNRPTNDVSVVRHQDGDNHVGLPLRNQATGPDLDLALERALSLLLAAGRPDLLLYQAGADPYREDPYSPLDLGVEDLARRDRRVFAFCRAHGIPVAWVLAGGYTPDLAKVVQVHVNTFNAAVEIFGPRAP